MCMVWCTGLVYGSDVWCTGARHDLDERIPRSQLMGKKIHTYIGQVLLLHGYTQNALTFYAKTSALRKKLQSMQLKCVYLNGPIKLTTDQFPSSDALSKFGAAQGNDDISYRGWWVKDKDGRYDLEESIATIKRYVDHGEILRDNKTEQDDDATEKLDDFADIPIVGLIGFSQGACLGGALLEKSPQLFGFQLQWAVLYSGFRIDTSSKGMPQYAEYYSQDNGSSSLARMLHVVGELDTVVGEDRAYTLYEVSKENSHILKHPGGHFVPNLKLMIDHVTGWIAQGDNGDKKEEKSEANSIDDIMSMMDKVGV